MALTANLVRSSIVSPGIQSIWTDNTVYGGANPLRNAVALYLTAYKIDEDQVETALTVSSFDPETVTTFTTANTVDGWYRYYFVIVNYWAIGTIFNKYDLTYDPTANVFYQYIKDTSSSGNSLTNSTYFTPISDPSSVLKNLNTSTQTNNIAYQVIDKVVSYASSIYYIKAASKHAIETCSTGDCGCSTKIGMYYHYIRDLFALLAINETTGKFLEGEKNARLLEKYADDCGCITR
jgi:hypothetical protein